MSGPTNEPIEVQRQEAYRNGLLEAKDMAWRRYKATPETDGGRRVALREMHDALMAACRQAEDVLRDLRADGVQADAQPEQFPYDRTFQAIAAAAKIWANGSGIAISVEAFKKAWDAYGVEGRKR